MFLGQFPPMLPASAVTGNAQLHEQVNPAGKLYFKFNLLNFISVLSLGLISFTMYILFCQVVHYSTSTVCQRSQVKCNYCIICSEIAIV